MSSFADLGTTLQVLGGVSLLLGVTMAVFWGTRRGHPGFGLWAICYLLVVAPVLLVSESTHIPSPIITVVVPVIVILAMTYRLEGLRCFFGRPHFDLRVLALPVVAAALLAVFRYAHKSDLARTVVIVAAFVLVAAAMCAIFVAKARKDHRGSYWVDAALAAGSALLFLAYAIYWGTGASLPLIDLDGPNFAFFIMVALIEVAWVIAFLTMGTDRREERLQAARAAAESSQGQLAAMVAFLPDATFAIDGERTVIAWNRAAEELTGVAAEAMVGKRYPDEVLPALDNPDVTLLDLALDPSMDIPTGYANVQRKGSAVSGEIEHEFPQNPGHRRHLWVTATVLRDAGGNVMGAVESIRDISSREQAERIIRQREQQYRAMFELNLDGVLAVAPDGAVLDANPSACTMLGMTKDEICATSLGRLTQRETGSEDALRGRAETGPETHELTYVRKDGTTFPAQSMSTAYCDIFGFPRAFVVFRDITEQKEAQRILLESEARLTQAQAVAQVGNLEIDLVARTVWLSAEAARIYGVEMAGPYVPFNSADIDLICEGPGETKIELERLIREGGSCDREDLIKRCSDGRHRVVRSRSRAICDDAGKPCRIVGVIQDITDLRQADDAVRLTQYSVDHAGDQTFWLDSESRFAFVSDSTLQQLGYTREEFLNMTLPDLDPTMGPEDWPAIWRRIKETGTRTMEATHRTKSGVDIPVEVSMTYIVHEGREYNFVFARDITQRKAVEDSLRLTQLSVDHAADQIFWINPEGRFVFVSDSTLQQLGYSREEFLRMTIFDLDPTVSRDWYLSWVKVKQIGTFVHEAVHRTKSGVDIPVEVRCNYICYNGQEYNLVFARDISERKRTEELLEVGQQKQRQSEVMEAIGQIAGGIAHDFNNLLTAIIGYGNLIIASEDIQGKPVARDAEEIRAAAERASALTNQILAFARKQTLVPRVVSLSQMIQGMIPRVRETMGGDIDVSTSLQPEGTLVEIDVSQFEQVVMNLAANARDAMPDGGRFIVETRDVELDQDYCRVYPDLRPGNYALLSVSDTGVGMTNEILGRVFEPFFTTKRSGVGAGLGLSMVYGIVRQSGGYVNVYSEIGKGSTFKIYLPAAVKPAHVPVPVESPAAPKTTRGSETILVVEDEAPLRRLVARVLGGLGYEVFVAGSGPEALELLDDLERPPDLLLSDVVLPGGMQGNEVAAAFLKRLPGLPVLYVSGHARDAIVHAGRLDEGVNFLGKPFTPESLATKVREVLDGGGE